VVITGLMKHGALQPAVRRFRRPPTRSHPPRAAYGWQAPAPEDFQGDLVVVDSLRRVGDWCGPGRAVRERGHADRPWPPTAREDGGSTTPSETKSKGSGRIPKRALWPICRFQIRGARYWWLFITDKET
jgi:hypothetical protein